MENKPDLYAVLPLRDIVVFPHMIVPLFVGREKSVKALEGVMREDKQILLVTQKDASVDDPSIEDIHEFGTIGSVLQLLKLPDGTVKVLVEGIRRAKITEYKDNVEHFEAYAESVFEDNNNDKDLDAVARSVINQFEQYVKLNKKIPAEVLVSLNQIDDPSKLADTIASHLSIKVSEKQELLVDTEDQKSQISQEDYVLRYAIKPYFGFESRSASVNEVLFGIQGYYLERYFPFYTKDSGGSLKYTYRNVKSSFYRFRLRWDISRKVSIMNDFYQYFDGFFAGKREFPNKQYQNVFRLISKI